MNISPSDIFTIIHLPERFYQKRQAVFDCRYQSERERGRCLERVWVKPSDLSMTHRAGIDRKRSDYRQGLASCRAADPHPQTAT